MLAEEQLSRGRGREATLAGAWRLFGAAAAAHAKIHVCLVLLVGRVPRHGFRPFSKQRETNMVRSRDRESQDRVTFNMKNTSYYRF